MSGSTQEIAQGHVPRELEPFKDQVVCIRGFLYFVAGKGLVLSSEPDLKSCCIGRPGMEHRQIEILGDIHHFSEGGKAAIVKGKFSVDPIRDVDGRWHRLYVLKDAVLIENYPEWHVVSLCLLGGVGLVVALLFFLMKSKWIW